MQNLPSGRFFCGPDGMFLVFRESWGLDRMGPAEAAPKEEEVYSVKRICTILALLLVFALPGAVGVLLLRRRE